MEAAVAPERPLPVGRDRPGGAGHVRCPSCSRLLVLRSGPAITPHFAHRPRQSCRKRPGRAAVRPPQLEQLTLFELEFDFQVEIEPARVERRQPERRRRRRKAWLPRLIRWVKIRAARRD